VPDPRLDALASLAKSAQIVPTRLTFVDIAGLVRGASKGEGLGNQFLANIREVDAIAHVVRCFEDTDVTHVENRIDPIADIETIETELMLAISIASSAGSMRWKRRPRVATRTPRRPKRRSISSPRARPVARRQAGAPHRAQTGEEKTFHTLGLLTSMPVLYVCNVDEAAAATGNTFSRRVEERAQAEGAGCVVISAKIEAEIAVLSRAERADYLAAVGLQEPGLDRLIRAGYALLDLVTYFTAGPKEARAWT